MAGGDDDAGEKTEDATPQKREDFRKRGQVAQSKEISSVMILMGSTLALWFAGRFFLEQIFEIYNILFGEQLIIAARDGSTAPAVRFALEKTGLILLPILLIVGVLGFASSVFQVGFLYNEDALELKLDRMDPVKGFQKMFSLNSWVEGLKSVIKLTIVGAIAWVILSRELQSAPLIMSFSIGQLLSYIGTISVKLVLGVGVFMAAVAILDYSFQRWELEKKMRMSKQEVKEEHKSREGDPMVKARIRRIQRELANKRMMEEVPKADVVITNPTHIAIALKYDETLPAPQVIAKGAGIIAEKIKERAKEHRIPVLENKPLARAIYKTLKIGQMIPRELFQAVAEVLAYVFKLKKKMVR